MLVIASYYDFNTQKFSKREIIICNTPIYIFLYIFRYI